MWNGGRIFIFCLLTTTGLGFKIDVMKINDSEVSFSGEVEVLLKSVNFTDLNTDATILEVHWKHLSIRPPNTLIKLWSADPHDHPDTVLESVVPDDESGRILVKSVIPSNFLNTLPRIIQTNQTCLNYWVGIMVQDRLMNTSCLQIRPSWMTNMRSELADQRISEIVIPGLNSDASTSLIDGMVSSWPQLMLGFRYFELDVTHETIDHKVTYLLKAENITTPLELYLKEVMEFLHQTQEVIFLEINIRPYSSFFKGDYFSLIQELIYDECKSMVVPRIYTSSLTFNEALKMDRRLIVYWYLPFDTKSFAMWDKVNTIDYSYLAEKDIEFDVLISAEKYHTKAVPFKLEHANNSYESCKQFGSFITNKLPTEVNFITVSCQLMPEIVQCAIEVNLMRHEGKVFIQPRNAFNISQPSLNMSLFKADNKKERSISTEARAWLTLRAMRKEGLYRAIQVNWRASSISNSTSIALFDEDPTGRSLSLPKDADYTQTFSEALETAEHTWNASFVSYPDRRSRTVDPAHLLPIFVVKPYAPLGQIATNFTMRRPSITELNYGGCLGFWVALLENTTVVYSQCFKSNPRWLWDNRHILSNRSIRSLVLPGSHNSGMVTVADAPNIIRGWIVCQEEEVISQLLYGLRYLDLRVSYYPDTKELLWINHATVRWTPLKNVLQDIKAFASLSKDIVIIDIHRTPVGFDHPEAGILLAALLEEAIGDHLLPSSMGDTATLKNIWRTNKNIIVSYGLYWLRQKYAWLWPPIYQAWADAQDVETLGKFLDAQIRHGKRNQNIWAAMGHLTGTIWDILTKHDGIRGLADSVGFEINEWLRLKWKSDTNILTTDFFHTTDIISVAIELNMGQNANNNVSTLEPWFN